MKNLLSKQTFLAAIVCSIILAFASQASAQKTDWKPYSYPADGFQATYPSMPEVTKKDIPTEAGAFELHTYIAEVGSTALFIGVCDYGSKAGGKDPQVLLEGAKNGALKNSASHLINEKKITLGQWPGIAFEATSENAQVTARIYMVGNVMYQTLVVAPLDKPFNDAPRFLDSFQLVPKTAN